MKQEIHNHSNLWPNSNWFRKHLNWTLVLYGFISTLVSGAIILSATYTLGEGDLTTFYLGWSTVYFGCYVYLLVWNLKHKGRSLWNLLYLLIPLGIGPIVSYASVTRSSCWQRSPREKQEKRRQKNTGKNMVGNPRTKVVTMHCNKCGHDWDTRVVKPPCCPKCSSTSYWLQPGQGEAHEAEAKRSKLLQEFTKRYKEEYNRNPSQSEILAYIRLKQGEYEYLGPFHITSKK